MRLRNKIVLVTGAGKGIGRAIALGMADEGADVIVNYNTDKEGAEQVVAQIAGKGGRAVAVQANISRPDDIVAMFRTIREQFGRLDAIVNNAGLTGWTGLFETTVEKWDTVMETNLRGTFFCSLEAAKMMRDSGGGSIVNVSTNCAELGVKNLVAYASSKGGIHAMTKQLAVELAPYRIRVNTFAPGPTLVDRNTNDDPDYARTWGEMVPLARVAAPEEMVGPAVFLASDDSSYMTGQIFYVDGGWTVSGRIPSEYFASAATKNAAGGSH
ncbi:SDR family NAD(P)-dependent oxidoreductase [Paenibacillus koleovorans]|uniref:SDR family NAD(P)-dependent oxidoreductase n=1 Tax=Paenibacillus koleovorans TaxID=121608 RepID=UPI000FDC7987|nr:3-oxoacyl-ACP reductase family protein [Paenibacillus koleovorans]